MKGNIEKIFQKASKNEKGITLVALVITIVIIVILASVTISATFGENGIIKQAELARDLASNATIAEAEEMNSLMGDYSNIMNGDGEIPDPPDPPDPIDPIDPPDPTEQEATPIAEVTRDQVFDKITKVSDASGDIFYVPGEFAISNESATDIDDGIVITNSGNTKQFVWIPVNDTSLGKMYEVKETTLSKSTLGEAETTTSIYSKLRKRTGDSHTITTPGNTKGIREPDILPDTTHGDAVTGQNTKGIEKIKSVLGITGSTNAEVMKNYAKSLVDEYKATYESIKKYDGFYIGRFELTGSVSIPTVQKGQAVLANQNWYNLKKACTNVVSSKYAQSTMVYGNQWDEVMSWLIATGEKSDSEVNTNSSSWGNYNDGNSPKTAGYSETWQANKIYDLAGNCFEWTQEAYDTTYRVVRGGNCVNSGSYFPASDRDSSHPYSSSSNYSSRPALYVALNAE